MRQDVYDVILKYDDATDKLVWVVNHIMIPYDYEIDYLILDGTTKEMLSHFTLTNYQARDIEIANIIYEGVQSRALISTNGDQVYFFDLETPSEITTIYTPNRVGEILQINDDINRINKLVFFPGNGSQYGGVIIDNGNLQSIQNISFANLEYTDVIYCEETQKIYAGGYRYGNGMTNNCLEVINPVTFEQESEHPILGTVITGIAKIQENKLAIASEGFLYLYENGQVSIKSFHYGVWSLKDLQFDNNQQKLYLADFQGGGLEIFDTDLNQTDRIILGQMTYKGDFIEDSKVAFYHPFWGKNSLVTIYDANTGDRNLFNVGNSISDVAINKNQNRLYVSKFDGTGTISIIDYQNYQLLSETIELQRTNCSGMALIDNKYLICAVNPQNQAHGIEIYDVEKGQTIRFYDFGSTTSSLFFDYAYDEIKKETYISISDHNLNGQIYVLNDRMDVVSTYGVDNARMIAYNDYEEKLFITCPLYNKIEVINLKDHSITQISIPVGPWKIEFCRKESKIAFIGTVDFDYNVYLMNCNDLRLEEPIKYNGYINGLKYNSKNNSLYSSVPRTAGKLYSIGVYNFSTKKKTYVPTGFKHIDRSFILTRTATDIVLDEENNYLYTGNGYSNVIRLEMKEEQQAYENGFNWISFPRFERTGNTPVPSIPLMSNLSPFPDQLTMTYHNAAVHQNEYLKFINNQWQPPTLNDFRSTEGYILEVPINTTLLTPGTVVAPNTPIQLYPGENWIGYFLDKPQDGFDALEDVLPSLNAISAQYWSAYKTYSKDIPEPVWVSSKWRPVKYGDMIKVWATKEVSFTWNGGGAAETVDTPKAPTQFSFKEDIAYTPIFVELDSENTPLEIGAFVGDSCVGGVTVEPQYDTSMVRAFIDESQNENIHLELFYETKSSMQRVHNYKVLDLHTGEKSLGPINTSKKQGAYFISLKDKKTGSVSIDDFQLEVFPNPVNDFLEVSCIKSANKIDIAIFDIAGKELSRTSISNMQSGFIKEKVELIQSNGDKLEPGIYFLTFCQNGITKTKKFIK